MTTSADLLDRAFHAIMTRMAQTGRAPNYVELGPVLGLDSTEARKVLNDLMATGYPGWLDENARSPTSPISTESAWTESRNGSVSEERSRWPCAGCFRVS